MDNGEKQAAITGLHDVRLFAILFCIFIELQVIFELFSTIYYKFNKLHFFTGANANSWTMQKIFVCVFTKPPVHPPLLGHFTFVKYV